MSTITTNPFRSTSGQGDLIINRSLAEQFREALKLVSDFSHPCTQFMADRDFNSLVQANIFFHDKGLFSSLNPEQVVQKGPNWVTSIINCFGEITERMNVFQAKSSSLEELMESAPNTARLVLDFISDTKRENPSQYRFFNPLITEEKLATVSMREDFDQEGKTLNHTDKQRLHEEFQAWLAERVGSQGITATTLKATAKSMQKYFEDFSHFDIALRDVERITGSYLDSIRSGVVSDENIVSIYRARQLAKNQEDENADKENIFETLKKDSLVYIQRLIDAHGENYLLRNKSAGKDSEISVTDNGPEQGRVKTYIRTRTSAQLTNMTLADLKKRVDSGEVAIINIEQKPGHQKITLDIFKPKKSIDFYNQAASLLKGALENDLV